MRRSNNSLKVLLGQERILYSEEGIMQFTKLIFVYKLYNLWDFCEKKVSGNGVSIKMVFIELENIYLYSMLSRLYYLEPSVRPKSQ